MFGNLGKMMKVASELKTKMPEMQARLAASEFTAETGGGVVTATVNGKFALVGIQIKPEVLADGELDCEMLEELIKAAVGAAQAKAAEAAAEAMQELTGGMDIPGLSGMMP